MVRCLTPFGMTVVVRNMEQKDGAYKNYTFSRQSPFALIKSINA